MTKIKLLSMAICLALCAVFGATQAKADTYNVAGTIWYSDGVTPIATTVACYIQYSYLDNKGDPRTTTPTQFDHAADGTYGVQLIITGANNVKCRISYDIGGGMRGYGGWSGVLATGNNTWNCITSLNKP